MGACHRGEEHEGAGMIRFVEAAIFPGVEQLFLERKAIASGTLDPESTHDSFRRFAICFLRAARAGGLTGGGQK